MLTQLETGLRDVGVKAEIEPADHDLQGIGHAAATLVRGGSSRSYSLIFGQTVPLSLAHLEDDEHPRLVFTTYVSPRTADGFRRAGVQYLDTAGNAWVEFGDVLIDVRGRPRPKPTRTPARTSGNLFSTGRAKVVFALLSWPYLWDAPQRELAHTAGVSLGQTHNTLALLADAGYSSTQVRPAQTALLDLWAAAFPTGLAGKLTLATYRGEIRIPRTVGPDDRVFVSGESAATDLLRPSSLTVYVEQLDPRLAIVNRWRADGASNIVVRRKFWNTPDDDTGPRIEPRDAPWPLVYADLLASDDPRVRSAATNWKGRHARSASARRTR